MHRCEMFGGYPVSAGQYCDSFERGKPATEKDAGARYEEPHHLHVSAGSNHCRECTYFWPGKGGKLSAGQAEHIRRKAGKLLS